MISIFFGKKPMSRLPKGTRLSLHRRHRSCFAIHPEMSLSNDHLVLDVDVLADGKVVFPKGTIFIGDWITDGFYLQLQISWVILGTDTHPVDILSEKSGHLIFLPRERMQDHWEYQKCGSLRKTTDATGKVVTMETSCLNNGGIGYLCCENPMNITAILQENFEI